MFEQQLQRTGGSCSRRGQLLINLLLGRCGQFIKGGRAGGEGEVGVGGGVGGVESLERVPGLACRAVIINQRTLTHSRRPHFMFIFTTLLSHFLGRMTGMLRLAEDRKC